LRGKKDLGIAWLSVSFLQKACPSHAIGHALHLPYEA
jgi:hypothetical protein